MSKDTRELLGSLMPRVDLPVLQLPWYWYTPALRILRCSGNRNQQDSKNCGNEAAADINLIKCPLVKRRNNESDSSCVGAVVHTPE